VQINDFFVVVDVLTEKKITDNMLLKCQQNYTKIMKTHLHIVNHHNLIKKFISMMKVDLF